MATIIRLLLIILAFPQILFAACPAPVGTVYTAVDASQAEVQDCVDDAIAATGGTVIIPAGPATYTTTLVKTITKDLTIIGAGTASTIITTSSLSTVPGQAMAFDVNTGVTFRLENLRVNASATTHNSGMISIRGESTQKVIKSVYFDFTGSTAGRMLEWGNPNDIPQGSGVIAHCSFYNPTGIGQTITLYGSNTSGWEGTPQWGSGTWATYVENNVFLNTAGKADDAIDFTRGGRVVFRYNRVSGTAVGTHGYDSTPISAHALEAYGNTFTNGDGVAYIFNIRGGTGLIWGNTVSDDFGSTITLTYYRSCDVYQDGMCGDNAAIDANSDATGYRCYQQPGASGTDGLTQWPIIEWDNTYGATANGIDFDLNNSFTGSACDALQTADGNATTYDMVDHVQEGRDFINHDTCVGVTSDFCTAWWDDVNKKAKNYTPYEYPHPLIGRTWKMRSTAIRGGEIR